MKNNIGKFYSTFCIIIILFPSCLSLDPKEDRYVNYTYAQIIKKHGEPKYDIIFIVDNNSLWGYEIDPIYTLFFTEEELENGVEIRKLIWEKTFNNEIIVWLKTIDENWIVFNSIEYNNRFVKF